MAQPFSKFAEAFYMSHKLSHSFWFWTSQRDCSQASTEYSLFELNLTLSWWTRIYPAFANSVDPDQLASEEANWSGSALFAIKYLNL